ncbi:MAG: ribonuclease HII, partial [Pontimonas sp.]
PGHSRQSHPRMSSPHLEVEHALFAAGARYVIGVDEVGRGAIAGPVWVSAGVWAPDCGPIPEGLRDSKLIPEHRRGDIAQRADQWLLASASGHTEASAIDSGGIMAALSSAGASAVLQAWRSVDEPISTVVLLDGNQDWLSAHLPSGLSVVTRAKADLTAAAVSAASVIAKVSRDQVMIDADGRFPGYGFAGHKGYGSAVHREAIARLGPCPLHRVTWISSLKPQGPSGLD